MAAVTKPVAARPLDAGAIVKDVVLTSILAFVILGPIVGLKTVAATGSLMLVQRWGFVAVLVAIVAGGRLAYHIFVWSKPQASPTKAWRFSFPLAPYAKYLAPALLVIALLLPWLPGIDRRIVDLAILMLTYIMLGWGLNIVVGLAGLLDLGYVAFYAVGAYSYALLSTIYLPLWFGDGIIPWAFYITLPIAGILAAGWGILLGFPVLRLRGDYLAIVTLAFGEIIRVILINWVDFTGGPAGIGNIPRPSFFGLPFTEGEGGFADTFGLDQDQLSDPVRRRYASGASLFLKFDVRDPLRSRLLRRCRRTNQKSTSRCLVPTPKSDDRLRRRARAIPLPV